MIVVGVDPGLRYCGVAVLERKVQRMMLVESRCIQRSGAKWPTWQHVERVCSLFVVDVLAKHDPSIVCIEDQVLVQQGTARRGERQHYGLPVRDIQYALAGAAWAKGHRVVFVQPQSAKKFATGSGRASKTQVERFVRALVGGAQAGLSEHEYDAMAIAMAGARR